MTPDEQMREIRRALGERGQASVGTLIDGLGSLVAAAKGGSQPARSVLRQLRGLLHEIDELPLEIRFPGES